MESGQVQANLDTVNLEGNIETTPKAAETVKMASAQTNPSANFG